MHFRVSLFTLLFIVLPSFAQAMTCETLMAEYRRVPISRVDLQEMQIRALEKAQSGQEEAHNKFRQEVVDLYDAEIAMAEERIQNLSHAFREEFSITERANFFSGARLVIAQEISNMQLDVREMQRERKQVYKLIPRPGLFRRAVGAMTGAWRGGSQSLNNALNPESKSEDDFLSPLNPAGPNYQFPNDLRDGDESTPESDKN